MDCGFGTGFVPNRLPLLGSLAFKKAAVSTFEQETFCTRTPKGMLFVTSRFLIHKTAPKKHIFVGPGTEYD